MTKGSRSLSDKTQHLQEKALNFYRYCIGDVWRDRTDTMKVRFIKTINLTVRTFIDKDVMQMAAALTYRSVLAIVPVCAMLFAIGRGFGFQNIIESELFRMVPAQREAMTQVMQFVDSYLSRASEGWFLGIGLIFLLWATTSLLSGVEDMFNNIWGISKSRPYYRRFTDYMALFILIPVFIVCSSGITLLMSNTMQLLLDLSDIPKSLNNLLDILPWISTWITFTVIYKYVPYTKVDFKHAAISGLIFGSAYQVLQWLFVTGQIYVSNYNAIYGSFAFLPLLLIWLQFSWLLCLLGCAVTHAAQNHPRYCFYECTNNISNDYFCKITIHVFALIVKRFNSKQPAIGKFDMSKELGIPVLLVQKSLRRLLATNLISIVAHDEDNKWKRYQPASSTDSLTVGEIIKQLNASGKSDFVEGYSADIPLDTLISDVAP